MAVHLPGAQDMVQGGLVYCQWNSISPEKGEDLAESVTVGVYLGSMS